MARKVVKKEETSSQLPAHMQGHAGMGTEKIGQGDIEIPRIKLLQALSPELDEIDGAKAGQFLHTIAEETLDSPLRIIPIYNDIRYILWRPRWEGGGILARADDGVNWNIRESFTVQPIKDSKKTVEWSTEAGTVERSGLAEWGSTNPDEPSSYPAANKMYNTVAWLPDYPHLSPVVVTLQRSQIKVAKKFQGKLKIAQAPSFGLIFTMDSFKDQNPNGDEFFNYKFTGDGYVMNEELYNTCMGLYQRFASEGLKIQDEEGLQAEADAQTDEGDARASACRKSGGEGASPDF